MMINAATVWDTNVATTKIKMPKMIKMTNTLKFITFFWRAVAMVYNKPSELTPFPRAIPPMANKIIDHGKLLRSSVFNNPVPKKRTMGMTEMIPDSPKVDSILDKTHHKMMVVMVTALIKYCFMVNGSLMGL